jgi:hypothetical protein
MMKKGKALSPSSYLGYYPCVEAPQNKEEPLTLPFNLLTNWIEPHSLDEFHV